MFRLVLLMSYFIVPQASAISCESDDWLAAKYERTLALKATHGQRRVQQPHGSHSHSHHSHDHQKRNHQQPGHNPYVEGRPENRKDNIVLWRYKNQVAIENLNTSITEIWEQTKTKRLRVTRIFESDKRGIEYQADEINNGKGETDWSIKRQLISDRLIESMTLVKTSGTGCNAEQVYSHNNGDVKYKLVWLPKQKLVKEFKRTALYSEQHWTLVSLNNDQDKIEKFFAQRLNYQLTDYADIGDNESDPFLINMINLGFVEHGSSGFYNAQGHPM